MSRMCARGSLTDCVDVGAADLRGCRLTAPPEEMTDLQIVIPPAATCYPRLRRFATLLGGCTTDICHEARTHVLPRAVRPACGSLGLLRQPACVLAAGGQPRVPGRARATRAEVVAFALSLALAPPALAVACEWGASAIRPCIGRVLHLAFVGMFALPLGVYLVGQLEPETAGAVFGAVAISIVLVNAYAMWRPVGLFLAFSVVLPVVGLASFVFNVPLAADDAPRCEPHDRIRSRRSCCCSGRVSGQLAHDEGRRHRRSPLPELCAPREGRDVVPAGNDGPRAHDWCCAGHLDGTSAAVRKHANTRRPPGEPLHDAWRNLSLSCA